MIKKLPRALCSPDKLDFPGYICLRILLAAIRQQNYTLVFLTQQRNHCRRLKSEKTRRFVRLFSSKISSGFL